MNADEFRDYILGFIFYKYLSEKMNLFANEILVQDNIAYKSIKEDTEEGMENKSIIIYNTQDGKTSVTLFVKEETVWMKQNQLAELFDTSKQNISLHIANILKDKELDKNSVVKEYLTTAKLKALEQNIKRTKNTKK